ncbi:MAG: hypothetical protein ABIK07_11715 [Planctomycetota bacterium]
MKCEKCGTANRKVVLHVIQSDICEACGHIPLSGRLLRLFLQVIAVLLFLGGLVSFDDSLVAGTLICLASFALFVVTLRHPRAIARKLLDVARSVSVKTSTGVLVFLSLVLIFIPAWIWIDASFQSALTWAQVDLGIPDETGRNFILLNSMGASYLEEAGKPTLYQKTHFMLELGPRIGVMILILCGSTIFIPLGLIHIVLNGASKKYIAVFTMVVCGIVALVYQRENLLWYSVQQRVSKKVPRFQTALEPLLQKWPSKPGTLPEAGNYFANEQLPGQLFLRNETTYGVDETFGTFITQLPDKGISFSLEPHYLFQLEFHPSERGPLTKVPGKDWTQHLIRTTKVAESWYLTQYKSVRN